MSEGPAWVLDSSAVLAYLLREPGADVVEAALGKGAYISAANWAEVLSKLSDLGQDPQAVETHLREQGILDAALAVRPLNAEGARTIAQLRPQTRPAGLSLGDRACLALGREMGLPVLTADGAWARLALDVAVQTIR